MIGLYFKEGIKWLEWTNKYDYLVTRYAMMHYFGEVPDGVKDHYLTNEGVDLARFFMKRLYSGDFYLEGKKWVKGHVCYRYYLGLDSPNYLYPFLTTCGPIRRLRYIEVYWFKHIIESVFNHYIGEGEAIAGVLLENGLIKLVSRDMGVGVMIDISDTYLPMAFNDVRRFMKGKKRIKSVTWANRKIIMINDLPVEEK